MDMENMMTLTTDEKVVQMCDMFHMMDERIKELEADMRKMKMEDENKTQAYEGDIANMNDFEEGPGTPRKAQEEPRKEEEEPKEEVKKKEVKKKEVKKKEVKKKEPKKQKVQLTDEEKVEEMKAKSLLPYDPLKCRRRLWNGGHGCQCGKPVHENGLCKVDYGKLYDEEKKKKDWAEKETFPEGYYDEEKSPSNMITGKWNGWKGMEKPAKVSKKKVSKKKEQEQVEEVKKKDMEKKEQVEEVKEKVEEVKEQVEEVKEQVEEEVKEQVEEEVKKEPLGVGMEAMIEEAMIEAEHPYDLEEELGSEEDLDEQDMYDDFEYQGVMYQVKGKILYTVNFEEIGTCDGEIAIFMNEEIKATHDEHPDKDEDEE
jgi:hypothetical protein